jgi:hypothetical protein
LFLKINAPSGFFNEQEEQPTEPTLGESEEPAQQQTSSSGSHGRRRRASSFRRQSVLKDNGMSPLSSTAAVLSRLNENKLATEVKNFLSTMTVVSWLDL